MSSPAVLRQFISDRLASVADDIFGMFEKTITTYEEELERHRKLLDAVFAPSSKLPRKAQQLPEPGEAKQAAAPAQEEERGPGKAGLPDPPTNDGALVCQKPGLKQEISDFQLLLVCEENPGDGGPPDCGPGEPPAGQHPMLNKSNQTSAENKIKHEHHPNPGSGGEWSRNYKTNTDDSLEQQLSEVPAKDFLLISSCVGNFNIEAQIPDPLPTACSADKSAPSQSSVEGANRQDQPSPGSAAGESPERVQNSDSPKPKRDLAADAVDGKRLDSTSTPSTCRKSACKAQMKSHNAHSPCSCNSCTKYFTSCHVIVKHIDNERHGASSTRQKYRHARYASEMLRYKMNSARLKTPAKSSEPGILYTCNICRKSYNRYSTLKRHLKSQMHIGNYRHSRHRRTSVNKTT